MGKGQTEFDPITLEVIRNGLISSCREMGKAMSRTAYSVIFSEGYDFSCAIFDKQAEMVAQAEFNPVHLGAMAYAVEWCLKEIGLENIYPGDVILHNDPFRGGTHITDFTIMIPVFIEDELVAIPANRAHLLDIGGKVPGGFAGDSTEIFQEGITIPPVKVSSRGEVRTDIWKIILSNVRVPKLIYGDFQAMIGSLEIGKRGVMRYIDKYGKDTFLNALEEIKDYSERRMKAEIVKLPKGTFEGEDYLDDDGINPDRLKVKVAVTVTDDMIIADYSGTSPQAKGPINATYGVVASQTYNAVLNLTDPYIPTNHGCFRPIRIIAPPTTIVNADYPAAVFGGNVETSTRMVDAFMAAMAKAIPEKVAAGCYGTCQNFTGGGIDHNTGDPFVYYLFREGGWGGRATKDGNDSLMNYVGNDKNQPIEILENRYPWIIEAYELVMDSGGPGKFRGGIGAKYIIRILNPEIRINLIADKYTQAPFGLFGGLPPIPRKEDGHWNDFRVRLRGSEEFKPVSELFNKVSPSKWGDIYLHEGDCIEFLTYGGGGYGDPLERDPEAVAYDVKNRYVSRENALAYYGVVVDPKTFNVEYEKTKETRQKLLGS